MGRSPKTKQRKGGEGRGRALLSWAVPAAVLGTLVGLYFVWPAYAGFVDKAWRLLSAGDREALSAWIRGYGAWGPAVLLALMVAQTVVAVIPSLLPMVACVLAYGPWWGGALAFGGLLVSAAVGYGLGRWLGPVTVGRLLGAKTRERMNGVVEDYGVWAVIAARLSPVLSTDAVSIVAGLLGMGWRRFLLATAAGTLPLVVLIAVLGTDIDRMETGLIWISAVSLAAVVGYAVWRRRTGKAGR
jgi:uncharacterized membrane protein YdjX (TVP38/TMEM64 family)